MIDGAIVLTKTNLLDLTSSALQEDIDMSNSARSALESIKAAIIKEVDWVHVLSTEE